MTRRIAIQWRLALTSLVLVSAILVATGTAVVLLQREAIDDALATRVQDDAKSLLAVAVDDDDGNDPPAEVPPIAGDELPLPDAESDSERWTDDGEWDNEGPPPDTPPTTSDGGLASSARPYLVRRSASETLLAVRAPNGETLINDDDARELIPYLFGAPRVRRVTIDGDSHQVAITRDPNGTVAAAGLSREEAEEDIAGLIRAFLIAGAVGGLATIALAWITTRRALRPLSGIADRAETITAGALDVRVGPVPGTDEISRLAASIDLMLGRLEDAFAAQQRFVQDASHELRTPITIARGHLDVVDPDRDDPSEVRTAIDLAISELERMSRLVERLLVLARTGDTAMDRAPTLDLATIADEAIERIGPDPDRRLTIDLPDDPVEIRGDREALVDTLVNLLANARRHTPEGGTITISIRADGDRAEVVVQDDGEGIDPALLPHIFERFSRGDRARGRETGGTGLGLAICKAYVEAHGGTIRIASEHGVGTTVTIRLPRVR